jgi:dipeptidase E
VRRLLLVSTSTTFGTGYLDHCAGEMKDVLGDSIREVLFVPYALHDRDGYEARARERFERMGYGLRSIHREVEPAAAVDRAEAIFIGGGNTFRLLRALQAGGYVEALRRRVGDGLPSMGASAGTNVAAPTIRTTNDMPIVQPPSFEALGLVPFQINPHFIDAEASSRHMGETREDRLREYLEENAAPVVGLREGAWLRREGASLRLGGRNGARLFRRAADPEELDPQAPLDHLL